MSATPFVPVIEQACGVLVLALRTTPGAASDALCRAARCHEVSVERIAAAMVAQAGGCEVADPLLRKVLREEWGDLLR